MGKDKIFWAIVRIEMGLIFLWAFFDKVFGLGFGTCRDKATGVVTYMCDGAWLNGASPTAGFLLNATKGPFVGFYKYLATNPTVAPIVVWLFMLGLLFVGLTLTLGIFTRWGSLAGFVMLVLMYTAAIPPANHPFLDEHLVYATIMLAMVFTDAGRALSLGKA